MSSYNLVVLLGNLTRDVELRHTPSGAAVADVGIAVNEKRKGPNGQLVEETTFVDLTLWNRTAEVAAQYLSKGSSVLIEGRLKLEQWQADDGSNRRKLKVVVNSLQMLGSPKGAGSPPPQQREQEPPTRQAVTEDDDIPF